MKVGVLVFNLGGPETLRDVKPFLYRLFSDPEIIHVKWSPLRKAIAFAIATLRRKTWLLQANRGRVSSAPSDGRAVACSGGRAQAPWQKCGNVCGHVYVAPVSA
ncbi:MAG: hypothetical protein DMG14_27260 [Acidobacteria bacterium]|nr:MAG: hypothetical protein DMG14_27260 [Acidobacteriota bacterium]